MIRLSFLGCSFISLTISFGWFYSFWTAPDTSNHIMSQRRRQDRELQLISEDCNTKRKHGEDKDIMGEVTKTHEAIQ
jgi:hypothetical protein